MSQLILDPVLSGYNLAKVNDNFKRIEEAFNTLLLHKDGSKALTSDLDVNSQKLLNVGGIEIGGVDLLESITSLQESYNAYISEMEAYKSAVEGILDEAISYGAVDKKSIGNAQSVFTTNQAYAKNSNLTLPLKYIVGKNTLRLSLGHTYLLYRGVDYEEVGVVGEESQTIKILRASGIGIGVTIEQVVDGDNDLIEIFENAQSLYTLLTTNYSPTKVEAFINSVSDVKELGIEDKISELWGIYNNLSALQVSFANTVADINTKYSTITDMYEDVNTKYSLLETLYPQLVALITDTNFDLDGLNAAVANILSSIQELQALTGTIESNAQTASTAATSASTSAETSSNNATIAANSATRAQIWAEGTDTEVEGILGEHSSKGWAEEAKRYATGNIIEALGYTPADDADLGALDAVAVKHTEQTLTSTQQAQARTNIAAASSSELNALSTTVSGKQDALTFDSTPTANSTNPVTSAGIKTAIETAVANVEIAVDNTVTDSSSNPVKSSGIFSHVKACVPKSIGSGTKPVYSNANGVITESGSNVGNVTRPICMVSGTLTQCTHTLEKSVPSDAEFLPAQTGHAGEYLKTDGETASWSNVESLPSQTGNAGKVLTTDGTTASWQPVQTRNIGEIVQSAIPLTDAGLHLLDGSEISNSGIYTQFVSYISSCFENQNPQAKWFKTAGITLPTFTSNTQDGITISDARGNTTNLQAIFNGSSESVSIGSWSTYWISVDYAKNTFLSSYTIQADNSGNPEYPSDWKLQGSNDGTAWTDIHSKTSIVFTLNQAKTFSVDQTVPYKKYRLLFSNGVVEAKGNGELKKVSFNASEVELGYENSMFATEEQWQACVAKYGSCGKFVVTSSGVRLPKVSDILQGTTDVTAVGDLIEAGLPNITGNLSTQYQNDNNKLVLANGVFSDGGVVSSPTWEGNANNNRYQKVIFDASRSSPIYGKSTTVQPQTIKALLYICVATSVKTQIQVDIDNIATDLNGKADKDLSNATAPVLSAPYVVETWRDGTSWYRKWSDGWIEQGGYYTISHSTSAQTKNLITAFSSTDYTIVANTYGNAKFNDNINVTAKTTTTFNIAAGVDSAGSNAPGGFYFYACGK